MKKTATLIGVVLLFLYRSVAAETVTIAVGEWPPYTSQVVPSAQVAQKIVTAAFLLEGVHVEYRYFPWKRAYVEVRQGHVDATFPWYKSKARTEAFLFNHEPLLHGQEVFFHLKTLDFRWRGFDDLKRYRVGGTLGFFDTSLLEQHGVAVDKVSSEEQNFEKMLRGRVDVYATTREVGYYLIHKLFSPTQAALFTHDPTPLHEADAFVMFSREIPQSEALISKLDRGLRMLKASGRYGEILSTVSSPSAEKIRPFAPF
ncbi:substrate-binding periplasmic protein [Mangrovitalea sediminis]|uniref:substrate-binding periplasmic protein n=1 Tax=Mangrovitalea sediminis TaxID=1982043 RepID=UPI000BE4F27D|nr:transporter substrate-binding domain-containing protein [Mangrovitalea sediminis]